jgi:hypothetical protein
MGELACGVGSGMGPGAVLPSVQPFGLEKPGGDVRVEVRGQG